MTGNCTIVAHQNKLRRSGVHELAETLRELKDSCVLAYAQGASKIL